MKRQLMAEQWDQFARQVLPASASAAQKQEMRRAFYAGAQAIFAGVIMLAADNLYVDLADEFFERQDLRCVAIPASPAAIFEERQAK